MKGDRPLSEQGFVRKRWVLACLLGCLIAAPVAFVVWYQVGERRLQAELERLRQAGEPMTGPQLLEQSHAYLANHPDLSERWQEFIEEYRTACQGIDWRKYKPLRGYDDLVAPSPWPQQRLTMDFVAEFQEVIDRLHELVATGQNGRIYRHQWNGSSDGFELNLAYLDQVLRHDNRLAIRRDDRQNAVRLLRTRLGLWRLVDGRPAAGLIHHYCEFYIYRDLVKAAEIGMLDEGCLEQMQQTVSKISYRDSARWAVAAQRVECMDWYKEQKIQLSGRELYVMTPSDVLKYLQVTGAMIAASNHDWVTAYRIARSHRERRLDYPLSFGYGVVRPIEPWFDALMVEDLTMLTAVRRCAEVSLALIRRHRRSNDVPGSLDEIATNLSVRSTIDPFVGKSLRYRRNGRHGFVIYSVGENLRDDDGDAGSYKAPDLGFRVSMAP